MGPRGTLFLVFPTREQHNVDRNNGEDQPERHDRFLTGEERRLKNSRDSANDLLTGALSWFEFIDFRRDIVVSSLFSRHQIPAKGRAENHAPLFPSGRPPNLLALG
jgi:hypothetical protein